MGASDDDALLPTPLLQLRLTPEKWRHQVKTLNKIEVYYQPFQFEKKKKRNCINAKNVKNFCSFAKSLNVMGTMRN